MKKIIAMALSIIIISCSVIITKAGTLIGDVDKNGQVNSSDALKVLAYSIGFSKLIDKTAADVNCDGRIDSSDALCILQISIGKVSSVNKTTTTKTTTKATTTTKPTTKATTTTKTTTKATTTTKPTTKATTAKPTTTATKKKITYSCPYETTPGDYVKLPSGLNAKHKRAWMLSKSGLDIKISRIEYGSAITQKFDAGINKQIVNPKTITYNPACTIAVITCDSPTRLNISKGTSMTTTEANAKANGAVIAIPGTKVSYWQEYAATIRSGSIYKKFTGKSTTAPNLVMYKDGTWKIQSLNNTQAEAAVKAGAYNSFYIQDKILVDGKFCSAWTDKVYRNRSFLGQIDKNHYVMVATEFMPIKSVAEVMQKYGVKTAVMVCGGNCTTMYLQGVGNSTNSTGASIKNMNKLGYYETEWFALKGMMDGKHQGGPCSDEYDCIYFK